jgi:hypothetical protein
MTPFILKQHDKDNTALRELRDSEIANVAGGYRGNQGGAGGTAGPINLTTVTVTPNGDGGNPDPGDETF